MFSQAEISRSLTSDEPYIIVGKQGDGKRMFIRHMRTLRERIESDGHPVSDEDD